MQKIRRRRQSADVWQGVLADFARSGLSVEAYCEREGVCRSSFYRWRALLGGSQGADQPAARRAANTTGGFIDLGTVSRPGSALELRVELGDGVVLHLTRG